MATFHGKTGSATFGGTAIDNITDWSVTITLDSAEAASMGDTAIPTWAGHYTWSATITGNIDDTNDPVADPTTLTAGALVIQAQSAAGNGSIKYSGTACISNLSPAGTVNGIPQQTFSFEGSGALTVGTIEA